MDEISDKLKTLLINLFDDPDEEVTVIDPEFNIVWVNKVVEKKGFLMDNIVGHKSYKIFDNLDSLPKDSSSMKAISENIVVNAVKTGFDGKEYDIISVPILNEDSKLIYLVELTRPVTDKATVSREIDLRSLSRFREYTKQEDKYDFQTGEVVLSMIDSHEYFQRTVDVLENLINSGYEGIAITFSDKTYDMVLALQNRKIDTDKIKFVDGISISKGKGTPPVKFCIVVYPPKNYQDIYYYTFISLAGKKEKSFIIYIGLENMLQYVSHDDLGVSLLTTLRQFSRQTAQIILLSDAVKNRMLEAIIRRLVTRIIRL